ncbi:homocysteine S-methyltransferase [Brevibacterium aurantiacum]|uniref:Homocysteine S-methyltransferase n=1 Tax=Brevibacterium aurantiacum TaxID=273384 RepID=A0A2A3X5B8_BREAU|nr:homocysteine S-methyltransferase [Brevibacterium aurantiacum]PCC18965.1 homocysteine S-methyltransferase [Brevibacterium aurantiacum]
MSQTFIHLLQAAVRSGDPLVIDGGLGTALESRGIDLSHELWSAALLRDSPETLAEVHADFIRAGAQIVTTASYQATPLGFERASIPAEEGLRLIARSVEIAAGAGDALVAGSIGPYGAALGNGAEYTGDYHLSDEEFAAFHRPRIEALVNAGADLLAIETQPSLPEITVLAGLADEYGIPAWLSVTLADQGDLADGSHMADRTPLSDLAEAVADSRMIRAVGVNCVRPSLVAPALAALASATDLPLIAYPNSGETYDAATMEWREDSAFDTSPSTLAPWVSAGVRIIGGCCRTTPADIAGLADSVPQL